MTTSDAARLRHTPYDGTAKPFAIGLKTLDLAEWFEIDGAFDRYLDEKERLFAEKRSAVFAETPASRPAQDEALRLVASHLPQACPDRFQLEGATMEVRGRPPVDLSDAATPPLWHAARLVQDDLVIMEKADDGWRLTAASLSFPSSWSLEEKFDRPMEAIHADVPGFGAGTRNAELIARMFDRLRPEMPVWRLNWSIYPDDALHHPKAKETRPADFVAASDAASTFLRVEKQTLRRLPATGAILFTIRIYVDPIAALFKHLRRDELVDGLREQLAGLDEAQLAYKGLRDRVNGLLDMLAVESPP